MSRDIPVKYKFNVTEDIGVRKELPPGSSFGYQEGEDFFITQNTLDYLVGRGVNVERAISQSFQRPAAEVLEEKKLPHYKIFDYLKDSPNFSDLALNPWVYPADVDFKSMLPFKFEKKILPKNKGVPTAVEYYLNYDETTGIYSEIIARRDLTLVYDELGLIKRKIDLLSFYKTDGTLNDISEAKDIGRKYDPIYDHGLRMEEGYNRRSSIVDDLSLPVLGVLNAIYAQTNTPQEIVVMGREFLDKYESGFDAFKKYSKKGIITDIENATEPWLEAPLAPGLSVRNYIIDQLSISY